MASLSSINTQIGNVNEQIATNNDLIQEKREELRRLKEAQSELISTKHDFLGEEDICEEPEFTMKTFHGDNSNTHDAYRRVHIKESFREISVTQIMDAIAKMQEKINELSGEIDDIGQDNRDLGIRQVNLYEQREEEMQTSSGGND